MPPSLGLGNRASFLALNQQAVSTGSTPLELEALIAWVKSKQNTFFHLEGRLVFIVSGYRGKYGYEIFGELRQNLQFAYAKQKWKNTSKAEIMAIYGTKPTEIGGIGVIEWPLASSYG